MSETAETHAAANPNRAAVVVIGLILLIGGGIFAIVQKLAADNAARADLYADALSGVTSTTDPLAYHTSDAVYALMWGGVAVAGVGGILLIILLVTVAAQPHKD